MDINAVSKKHKDYIEKLIVQITPLLPNDVNKLQEDYLISNLNQYNKYIYLKSYLFLIYLFHGRGR